MAVPLPAPEDGVHGSLQAVDAVCRAASAASTEPRAVASVAAILAVERIVRDANSWRVVNIVGIGSQEAFENARKQRFRHHQNWLRHVPT